MSHSPRTIDRPTLGIDIGGANLKYADTNGNALSVEFPLWMRPDDLAFQLADDIAALACDGQVVATMTGELADCFRDRSEGVTHIVDQLCRATKKNGLPPPLIYSMEDGFVSPEDSRQSVDAVAAGNWHALASLIARDMTSVDDRQSLLVDIGSTTTDLIPMRGGVVATSSRTDFDRLAEGSLVYLGGGRTPICAIMNSLECSGQDVPVMREVFATMDDVRILMGFQKENATDCRTADGKPRDAFHAANRMARMVGLDHRSIDIDSATELAQQVHRVARGMINDAAQGFESNSTPDDQGAVFVSGHCRDLVPLNGTDRKVIFLEEEWGTAISRAAPAYAAAKLYST